MRRLVACGILVALLVVTWAPAARAGSSTDIALGLASFAVFNQLVGPLLRPRPAEAVVHHREVVYVQPRPVVYHAPAVVYAPPPAVVTAPPPQTTVVYPHGRYELQLHGHQYVWVWIPTTPPPPPPPPAALPPAPPAQ